MGNEAPTEVLTDYWSEVTDLDELRDEVRRYRDDHNRVCAQLFQLWLAATGQEFGPDVSVPLNVPEGDLAEHVRALRAADIAVMNDAREAVSAYGEIVKDLRRQKGRALAQLRIVESGREAAYNELHECRGVQEELEKLRAFIEREASGAFDVIEDETVAETAIRLLRVQQHIIGTITVYTRDAISAAADVLRKNGISFG